MKKLYVLAMSILLIISFPNFIYANNSDVPQKVQDAADRSLDSAKGLFTGNPEKWGFDSDEAIENITLSDGYKIRYLDEDKLMNYNNKTLMDVTFETDYWQYIIYLNGKPKTLLTVGPVENGGDGYELVELGGDAKELDYTLKNFDQSARKIKRVQNKKPIIADIDFNEFLILEMDNEEELVLPVIYENNWFSEETDMDNETFVKSEELIKLFRKNYKEPSGELQLGGGSEHFRKQKVISVESPETHKIQVL